MFKEIVDWGGKVNCEKIIVHINQGVYFTLPDKKVFIYETDISTYASNVKESLDEMAAIAKSADISLCIENTVMSGLEKRVFEDLFIENEDIGFAWDIGHDAKNDNSFIQLLSSNQNRIWHMHLHDFDGKMDHLSLYEGCINIDEKIEFAKQHGISIVIEVKTIAALTNSVERLKKQIV